MGVSWMLLSFSIQYSGQIAFPQFALRLVALVMVVPIYLLLSKDRERISAKSSRWIFVVALIGLIGGILDGIANLMWSELVTLRTLHLGAIASIFGPFIVLILAYWIYKERLTRIQAFGLAIAALGAFIVAIA